jgi:hypothetical protein
MNMHLYLVATVISTAAMPSSARVSTAVIAAIAAAAVLIAAIAAVAAVSVAAVALLYLAVAAALFDLRCERRLVAAAAAKRKVNEPRFFAVILLVILFSVGVVSLPLLKADIKAAIIIHPYVPSASFVSTTYTIMTPVYVKP